MADVNKRRTYSRLHIEPEAVMVSRRSSSSREVFRIDPNSKDSGGRILLAGSREGPGRRERRSSSASLFFRSILKPCRRLARYGPAARRLLGEPWSRNLPLARRMTGSPFHRGTERDVAGRPGKCPRTVRKYAGHNQHRREKHRTCRGWVSR